jgi:serine/threonine protein kinase
MTPERWREITQIYGAVVSRAPEQRAAAVAKLCGTDETLRREIESLLESQRGVSLIDRPASDRGSVMQMVLPVGSQIGVFRIDSLLGVGGMGEVYRARDTKLNRDVAFKILPPVFANEPDRLARFKREAQVLASLNHPNIGAIYGFEDSPSTSSGQASVHGLVLELVEGPTLADRIARGRVTIEEALPIARQIADALDVAHEQGIIHRDLKPANIKVRDDGTVKVLDFGLAKLADPVGAALQGGPSLTQSPTITTPAMTAAGVILGTAAYMSPEQAKGRPADKRSDIWAFGCVLYEMLTGKRAFEHDDVSETLASILRSEPDWSAVPVDTPPSIQRLLRRSLQKDVRSRLPHIGVARMEIDEATGFKPDAVTTTSRPRSGERIMWMSGLALLALFAIGASIRALRPSIAEPETRLDIVTPPTTDSVSFAISPDGRKVTYVGTLNGQSQLWLRELQSASARLLPRTEDASLPFWSPDSQSIAFFARGQLMRIDLQGDAVRRIAAAALGRGGAWHADGTILFASNALSGLMRTRSEGGDSKPFTMLKSPEVSHSFPSFLEGGRSFVYFVAGADVSGTYIASLDNPAGRRLVESDAAATYDGAGHLLFVRQGTLYAQSFDVSTGALSGATTPIASGIAMFGGAGSVAAVSAGKGTIVYRTGTAGGIQQFVMVDRAGNATESHWDPDPLFPQNPSLSPDGRYVVMSRLLNGNADIWMLDLTRSAGPRRITTATTSETYIRWNPDGDHVIFSRGPDLFLRSITRGTEEHFISRREVDGSPDPVGLTATDWSRDGRFILVRTAGRVMNGSDLFAVTVNGEHKVLTIARSSANEREGQFSPDGKWVAYQSDESSRNEIYVQRFPEGTDKFPVSTDGGAQPRWRDDGKELFYVGLDGRLMAAPIVSKSDGLLQADVPVALFATHIGPPVQPVFQQQYVVLDNGQKFLMNNILDETTSTPITVLQNWHP